MTAPSSGSGISVVLVDDDQDHLNLISMSLREGESGTDFELDSVDAYTDPSDALASLPADRPVAILCDYRMPGGSGLDWLQDFVKADVGPVILMTGTGDEGVAAEAFRSGAADYLVKSTIFENPSRALDSIREATRRFRLEHRNRELANELKRANAELERKNTKLAELTETAHRFVDNVAHEFRTPLAVIKEFASIIADGIGGPVTEKQSEYLHLIADATRDLAGLVDDFLDSGKLRAQTLRVDRRSHGVAEVLDSVRPLLEQRASARRIEIVERVGPDLPPAFCDIEKIGRIVVNLAVNAIKFSPHGSQIVVWAEEVSGGGIEIGVTDHGPGMSPDELATLFDRFRQFGNLERSTSKGFGLGLSIARELVWLNLGVMNVKSVQGAGSTFSFTLPPDDPIEVWRWYHDRVIELDGNDVVAMIEVGSDDTSIDSERLREFLCGSCHATDLVLPRPDGRFLLVGLTDEPHKWIAQLNHQRDDQAASGHEAALPFSLTLIGSWPARHADGPVRERLSSADKGRAGKPCLIAS